ncbi:MAG TPA: FAD-dependent oxidoreductase [Armatimonadota bacterium]|nr:FAD-dependent oxidoreductase [Armatimonadota bacterium]
MGTIHEASRETPVVCDADVCVIGGSCTGLFAAVRAARRGLAVALIENNGYFGGAATAGLVNVWHALTDTAGERRIIAGLTAEMLARLERRGAMQPFMHHGYQLNCAALVLELDALAREHPTIRPFLHAKFVAPALDDDGRVTHAVIEDKSGRRAIAARVFIDASGDGDLVARMGLPTVTRAVLQPPTACVYLAGLDAVAAQSPAFNLRHEVFDPRYPEALPPGFLWTARVPGAPGLTMVAGTRVHGANCADADQLTAAELESRRQIQAMLDLLRRHIPGGDAVQPVALPAYLGIRETRHAVCRYRLTETDVLDGARFPDAIANGTYQVDIHHGAGAGLTFRFLNGVEQHHVPGQPVVTGRWRAPRETDPTFYQIPYRCLVPADARNVLIAGRCIDADQGAHGAVRVMVNTNQMGEAAGLAAALARETGVDAADVDTDALRRALAEAGAIVL